MLSFWLLKSTCAYLGGILKDTWGDLRCNKFMACISGASWVWDASGSWAVLGRLAAILGRLAAVLNRALEEAGEAGVSGQDPQV